jgi:hypothetical protein
MTPNSRYVVVILLSWFSVDEASSSYNKRAKPTKLVTSGSSTLPLLSSPPCSDLPASTNPANTSKTIGLPNPPASTASSTKHLFSSIPASIQQLRNFASVSSSPAGKLLTNAALRKRLMSSLSKLSQSTKIVSATAGHNFRRYVYWQAHCRALEDSERRITTL